MDPDFTAEFEPANYDDEPFTGAILFCPTCCTNDDSYQWGLNRMTCTNCETEYAVMVEPAKVAAHSI